MKSYVSGWGPGVVDAQSARLGRILQTMQLVTGLVFLPVLFVVSQRLPVQLSWENRLFEMAQNVLLAAAVLLSVGMALRRRWHVQRWLWLGVALGWLLMLGRELSWGAVFLDPVSMHPVEGPHYSSMGLAYRAWIGPAGYALLALALGLAARAQPLGMLRYAWQRRVLGPWAYGLCLLLYAVVATAAEGKLGTLGQQWANSQVLEETFELAVYYFILRAQLWTFVRWFKPEGERALQ